ncbi:MAG TPA: hypothetical protein QGI85_05575 [Acidimicrobiales bacterium]|nr:hypothetical protein [Acidimicrobiales bacterium]
MKTALTIYLGNDSAFAAVEVNGQIDLLALGESEAGLPIKETLDTENLFYKEAEFHDEDLIHLEQSLANLFSRIIARCIRVVDIYPDEVLLVVSGDSSDLDVYYAASRRAQIINMMVIEENRSLAALASYGPKGISSDYAPAIGGLFWIRHGDSLTGSLSIVTREDLGAEEKVVKKPSVAPSAPSVISLGDRSVFDLQINTDRKKRFNLSWVVAVLILCTGVASVYHFAFSGSQESSTKLEGAVVPVTSVPVTSVPVTSVPVTSVPVTSVPVTSVPVTSVPVTSDDEEVIEVETVELGVVTLNENGLLLLAGTANQLLLSFDSPQEAVMSSLIGILGEPDEQPVMGNEICDSNGLQIFKFEDLEVVFKSYDMGPIFSQWFVSGEGASKTGLWTLDRIGLGSSIAELKKFSKGTVVIEEVFPGTNDPAGKFRIDPFSLGMLINGLTSNTNDQGKILQIWAGEGCQRLSED